jgi:hypothetical protein
VEINLRPTGVFPKPIELNTPLGLIPHFSEGLHIDIFLDKKAVRG